MLKISVKERGTTPRKFIKQHNAAKRVGFRSIADYYHAKLTPKRFTKAHGLAVGYRPRQGENLTYGSKAYWTSYTGRKQRRGHLMPLVWSGETRRRSRIANIVVTGKESRVKYQLNVLNFHPDLRQEFLRMLPAESVKLGKVFDKTYDTEFKKNRS